MEGGETVARLPNELYRALTREVNLLWNSEEDIKSTTGSRVEYVSRATDVEALGWSQVGSSPYRA
jgi:hypothetical protein